MNREEMENMVQDFCENQIKCKDCPLNDMGCDEELNEEHLAKMVEVIMNCQPPAQFPAPASPDNVNHPQHYELPGGLECFDVIVATQGVDAAKHFCLCNAMKYLFRSQRKNGAEDIEKARWYLNKHHDLVEGEGDSNDD